MLPIFALLLVLVVSLLSPLVDAAAFEFAAVVEKARTLAAESYKAPTPVPEFLRELDYDDYRNIRFKPDASLWRGSESGFEVMLVAPGSFYKRAVKINEIDADGVRPVEFDKSKFDFSNDSLARQIPADLGYAGFKLTYPLEAPEVQNQFMVFAGASYFRGVGQGDHFGISARGLAVNTGLRSGEEFPAFVEFWLERPSPDQDSIVMYALLDGPSVTGAYRFVISPGKLTEADVTAQLFFRKDIELLGLAPLTSMFYYGENTARPVGEWRPQVHDSDGLLIHNGGSGEWLWRPVINPESLRMSYFQTSNVQGFGLMQRDRNFHQFEDAEARYDNRPSAWVETVGDWGKGEVVLVEIPTRDESNDNIVAFWRPEEDLKAGQAMSRQYRLSFGREGLTDQPSARATGTFVGHGNRLGGGAEEGAYRLIVDFKGGPLSGLNSSAAVVSNATGNEQVDVLEQYVEYVEPKNVWRLSLLVRPESEAPGILRAFLEANGKALTETWTYELSPDRISGAAKNSR
ncbi:MAG: glucan biosynthesis protein G [Oleiphilaceae bacterium]|nr:glucan biosynthesis protein G [Oleiphilaceae bacterium]